MSPDIVMFVISVGSAVLLVGGGFLIGRVMAERAGRKRDELAQSYLATMQEDLNEARARADSARSNADALRAEMKKQVVGVVDEERKKTAHTQQSLQVAEVRMAEIEEKYKTAKAAADSAEIETKALRDQLDKAEKQLAEANQRIAAFTGTDDLATTVMGDGELQEAKRTAERLEAAEKERDQAKKRIQELEADLRKKDELARTVPASTEIERLRAEIVAANERVAISERVMEGVRARSNMLSLEIKKLKAAMGEGKNPT